MSPKQKRRCRAGLESNVTIGIESPSLFGSSERIMGVSRKNHFASPRTAQGFLTSSILAAAILAEGALLAHAQGQNPTSETNPFWGSVTAQPVSGTPLKLSLDDAVHRGLSNNLGLKEAEAGE